MNKIIASFIIAGTLIAAVGTVQAGPLGGSAARSAAGLGFITVGGAFDAR